MEANEVSDVVLMKDSPTMIKPASLNDAREIAAMHVNPWQRNTTK